VNRFEILLDKLTKKIALVRALCATIPSLVPAEKARVELEQMINDLRDESVDINKYVVGFAASDAELALTELRRVEHLVRAEAREVECRIRAALANGVVGSIRPVRRGRRADKREMDRQRRASMKTNTGGSKKQKSA